MLAAAAIVPIIAIVAASSASRAEPRSSSWAGIASSSCSCRPPARLGEGPAAGEALLEEERTRLARNEAAALDERQRIARELHDVLAHSLSALSVELEGARLLARDPAGPT